MKKKALYLILGGVFFHLLTASLWQSLQVNSQFTHWDQAALMKLTAAIRQSGNPFLSDGARHPLFSALSVPFFEWSRPGFARAKLFALGVSLFCFVLLLYLHRGRPGAGRRVSFSTAWLALFLAAPAGLSLVACQYIPDLLFTGLNAAAFIFLARGFESPRRAAAGGFLSGLAFLSKYSAILLIGVFILVCAGAGLLRLVRNRRSEARRPFLNAGLALAFFALAAAPLLVNNTKTFGSPLYNVTSRYYLWFDDWAQCKTFSALALDRAPQKIHREAFSRLPAPQRPSFRNYVHSHSLGAFPYRLKAGILLNARLWWAGRGAVLLALLAMGLFLAFRGRPAPKINWNLPALFALAYLGVYFLSTGWYAAVACNLRYLYPLHAVAGLCGARLIRKGEEKREGEFNGFWLLVGGLILATIFLSEPHQLQWPGWRRAVFVNGPVYPYE